MLSQCQIDYQTLEAKFKIYIICKKKKKKTHPKPLQLNHVRGE